MASCMTIIERFHSRDQISISSWYRTSSAMLVFHDNQNIVFIMVLCLVISCGNKTGKKRSKVEKVRFFRVPRVIVNQGENTGELTSEGRRMWISAISREDLTDDILERVRVCSQHFVSGEAAKDWDWFNVDWVPTLHLVHSKQHVKDPEEAAALAQRAANRRKRRAEISEKEV